jgi:hypothetical protein
MNGDHITISILGWHKRICIVAKTWETAGNSFIKLSLKTGSDYYGRTQTQWADLLNKSKLDLKTIFYRDACFRQIYVIDERMETIVDLDDSRKDQKESDKSRLITGKHTQELAIIYGYFPNLQGGGVISSAGFLKNAPLSLANETWNHKLIRCLNDEFNMSTSTLSKDRLQVFKLVKILPNVLPSFFDVCTEYTLEHRIAALESMSGNMLLETLRLHWTDEDMYREIHRFLVKRNYELFNGAEIYFYSLNGRMFYSYKGVDDEFDKRSVQIKCLGGYKQGPLYIRDLVTYEHMKMIHEDYTIAPIPMVCLQLINTPPKAIRLERQAF